MRLFSPRLKARRTPLFVAGALLAAATALTLPAALCAQAGDVATAAVAPFQDLTEHPSALLATKAMDAAALALADSKEYLVTPAREVDRELRGLNLKGALSTTEAVRLGKRLDVNSVCLGQIMAASVDPKTGKANIRLQIMMVDVEAAELLDGATVTIETKAIPGWSGTEADVLNDALRQASEAAVARMLATRVRRGTIEAVLPSGVAEVNLGSQDGAVPGLKMVVLRPVYLRELETVTLRKIGYVEIGRSQPDMCYADPLNNVAPRTGDYVVRVYQPFTEVKAKVAKQNRTQFFWGIVAVALVAGFAGIATGGNEGTPPPTPVSYLYQNQSGATPLIRVQFAKDRDKAFGHLLYRGPTRFFPADPYWLVEVDTRGMGQGSILAMDDQPAAYAQKDKTITVTYRDETGDWTTEDVDITYMHPELQAGTTYYHRIQRVTKPQFPPGTNPPINTGGGTERVFQGPEDNTITQGGDFPMLSQASDPTGPVTYITPVQLVSPPESAAPQGSSIIFEWSPTPGADEYMVEVFDASHATGVGQPIFRRSGIRARGATTISTTWNPATGDLAPDSYYYWRVGARQSTEVGSRGQGIPRVSSGSTEATGWVLSSWRSFATVNWPPGPVGGTSAAAGDATPDAGNPVAAKTGRQATAGKARPSKATQSPRSAGAARRAQGSGWQPAPGVGQ
jgi:hypothetical protein